jgi:hypothetical protein
MQCAVCKFNVESGQICKRCYSSLKSALTELPELQQGAASFVTPGRSGSGSPSTERSIGFNVNALDYSMGKELLGLLHKYEALIRRARSLTPPALLKREATVEKEVAATVSFHLAHLEWTVQQDWLEDFAGQIKEIHTKGMATNKRFIEQPRRIPCPTDECKAHIVIDIENLLAGVRCNKCRTSWTLYRLLALAMNNPNRTFWLDIDAICLWMNITKVQLNKIVKDHNIPVKNGLYDISAIAKARSLID